MKPTVGGFLWFIRNIMKIPTSLLSDTDPVIAFSFNFALALVNPLLARVPKNCFYDPSGFSLYVVAVYNLAGNNLVNFAQDAPDASVYRDGMPFWAYTRQTLGINNKVMGVIQSAGDEGTNESMQLPEWTKTMTMADLQAAKTPWGRVYLGLAQQYGPTIWGLSQ